MRLLLILISSVALAQDFNQRGFLDTRFVFYPQTVPNDSGRAVGEALFRYEASKQLAPGLRFFGAFDARTDTHRQVERRWRLNADDRTIQRPAFSVRRLSALYHRGKLTVEAGKQFVRWGKADILNPTDRFAPRDFLSVLDNDFLPIPAVRATYEAGATTVDAIWQVRFTPSRTPLLNQRWTVLPPEAQNLSITDGGLRIPGGPQFGLRINHVGRGFEGSVSFYEGHNHLPLIEGRAVTLQPPAVELVRVYPQLRFWGADAAVPNRWFTVKAEAGYFTSRTPTNDEFILYVVQLERLVGEWSFVGGYAGEHVTRQRSELRFAPDRGLTRAFLGRASYTIGPTQSIALETAVRENGDGTWLRLEYSRMLGAHWRATAGATLIRGNPADFLGQYRRNSNATLAFRYSF
jgi:hypothetical protein